MSANMSPVEKRRVVRAFNTNDINGVTLNEDRVSLKAYEHSTVNINVGNVAGDIVVTLKQSTDVGGAGEKALGFDFMWKDGVKTAVTSDTFTITEASDDNSYYEIPIDASELDIANDFVVLRIDLVDPSAAALVACHYEMWNGRYQGATMPDATID